MKRRKRKPKPKATLAPDSQPAAQLNIHHEPRHPASPVELSDVVEKPANSISQPDESEKSPTYVELQDEMENLTSSVELPVEIPLEIQVEIEQPAAPSQAQVQTRNAAAPVAPPAHKPAKEKPSASPKSPTVSDRRTHPRYAFTAPVEVVAAGPGTHLKTRVRDLSQQGCYTDTDNPLPLGTDTDVRIHKGGKSFEARARVVYIQPSKGMGLMFTSIPQEHLATLDLWISESRETSWLAANRRRSQRVLMKLPVRVSVQAGEASLYDEETYTLAISAHGALLVASAPLHRGQRLTLFNLQTKASLECAVAHIDKFPGQQIQVGVEFMLPNPTFWRVAFPPKDWTPRHPDAKSHP
jgi:hypothetical protein